MTKQLLRSIKAIIFLQSVTFTFCSNAQTSDVSDDAIFIRSIYQTALMDGQSFEWLDNLSTKIGGRLAGSPQAAAAVEFTKQELSSLELDSVWLQPCQVPHWVRGEKELVRIVNSQKMGTVELRGLALGNSVGTGSQGLTAEIIEVAALEDLERIGSSQIKGKIVFFNRPFDAGQLNTFHGYGGAVDQRGSGPSLASKYGAVGAIVRSMTWRSSDIPHTGVTIYEKGVKPIPAIAISTNSADLLSRLLREEPIKVYFRTTCEMLSPKISYNVIGEIRGSVYPGEILLIGGHLDSWDVGGGAHDDGAGCVQSMEVLRILKKMNYRPKRTIRCVLFMNEENGLAGALEYSKVSNAKNEFHLFALESDAGGFSPTGFSCDADESVFVKKFQKLNTWLPLIEPYNLTLRKGGSGADIGPLKSQKGLLCGLRPDSQRYFDYHHNENDTIEAVHPRELSLGAAAMTTMIYLVDKYGLD